MTDGAQQLTITAMADDGRTAMVMIEYLIDRTGSDVTVNAPMPNAIVGHIFQISAAVTDDAGVASDRVIARLSKSGTQVGRRAAEEGRDLVGSRSTPATPRQGWLCLAAVASDRVRNQSVSPPIRQPERLTTDPATGASHHRSGSASAATAPLVPL